jgi:hypothetical protein
MEHHMPANGAAAQLPLELSTEDTIAAKAKIEVELEIGEAAANAIAAMALAVNEHWNSGHSTSVRTLGGETIARLFALQEATLGRVDFPTVVRQEGKRVLFQRYSAKYGAEMSDGAFDILVDGVLEIVSKVTEFERAMAH